MLVTGQTAAAYHVGTRRRHLYFVLVLYLMVFAGLSSSLKSVSINAVLFCVKFFVGAACALCMKIMREDVPKGRL